MEADVRQLVGLIKHIALILFQPAARTRSIIKKKGLAGDAIRLIVPARYIDRDGQTNAKEPMEPECPMNSGSEVGQKKRGNWKYMRP